MKRLLKNCPRHYTHDKHFTGPLHIAKSGIFDKKNRPVVDCEACYFSMGHGKRQKCKLLENARKLLRGILGD